jgi:hypothetical protein
LSSEVGVADPCLLRRRRPTRHVRRSWFRSARRPTMPRGGTHTPLRATRSPLS